MNPYYSDGSATLYQGDCRAVLRELPAGSVQCVVTSPPYWAQRDYGLGGDGIGLEPTPQAWIAAMVDVMRAVRRVLRDDGTVWLNLGDKYAGSGGAGGDYNRGGLKEKAAGTGPKASPVNMARQDALRESSRTGQPAAAGFDLAAKNLMLLPHRLTIALQDDGWIVRADIIWAKPAPMPESCTDRPTTAHEHIWLLTKRGTYYYDAEAVREAHATPWSKIPDQFRTGNRYIHRAAISNNSEPGEQAPRGTHANPAGRNLRSVWTMNTQPFPDAHYAVFPEELPRKCILAGTSEKGRCPECGAPWERVVEVKGGTTGRSWHEHSADLVTGQQSGSPADRRAAADGWERDYQRSMTGWRSTCDHDAEPVPCVVLDPFAGTFTTGKVAKALGRHAIGIELSADYCEMAVKRCAQMGMALTATVSGKR